MADIVSRPATDAYRSNWERIFGARHVRTKCVVCATVSEGNLEKCPVCRSVWIEKVYEKGEYAPNAG